MGFSEETKRIVLVKLAAKKPGGLEGLRKRAGWSRDRAAVEARVAYATCRLYEVARDGVRDPEALARLDAVYSVLAGEQSK